MSIPDMIRNLPFAIVDEEEARVLGILAERALAGNGAAADALIARLNQDWNVHFLADNFIKGERIREAIEQFVLALPENMS